MATMTLSEMLIIRKGLNNLINFYLGAIKQSKIFWGGSNQVHLMI